MRTFLLPLLIAAASAESPQVLVKARASAPGEAMLVVVLDHDPASAPTGSLGGVALSFFPGAHGAFLAFAGVDLSVASGTLHLGLELKGKDGAAQRYDTDLIVDGKEFTRQELKVQQDFVTPKKSSAEQAEGDSKRLREIFSRRTPRRFFKGDFLSPIPGSVSARFGERRVFNGLPKAPHSGADLRAAEGTKVKAPAGGKVVLAGSLFYQGNTVVLDHGYGLFSYYAHLSEISVKEGDILAQGKVLGKVGATGRVTGPHLHWAVKLDEANVDPFSLAALDLKAWLP